MTHELPGKHSATDLPRSTLPPTSLPSGEVVHERPFSPYAIAVAGFGFCDLVFVPVVSSFRGDLASVLFIGMFAGVILAQFGALSAWLVWGDRPYHERLVTHWLTAFGLCGLFILGALGEMPSRRAEFLLVEIAIPLLCLPAVSLAIEGPLWVSRLFFGWRLQHPAVHERQRPLAIRDFLVGMTVIAVALAAARFAASLFTLGGPGNMRVWNILAIYAGIGMAGSSLTVLPAAWWMLRLRDVYAGITAVVVYAVGAFVLITAIIGGIAGGQPHPTAFGVLFLGVASCAAALAGSFYLARAAGYRLQVGKAPNAA